MSAPVTMSSSLIKSYLPDAMMKRTWCTDLDACRTVGIHSIKEDVKNLPKGAYHYGTLYVGCGGYWYSQMYKPSRSPKLYFRLGTESSWEPWYVFTGEVVS